MVELSDNLTARHSNNLLPHIGDGIVIDIGTGDGHFVYQCARENPTKFYIGIDANPRPLEKISEKVHRRPARGGVPNVLFLQAAVEDLPHELDDIGDEVHIHFPWGSLLHAVTTGDALVLRNLHRICATDAWLEIIIGLDRIRDQSEIRRWELPRISLDYLESELTPKYQAAGFKIVEKGAISPAVWPKLKSTWAKRLCHSAKRELVYLIGRPSAIPATSICD